MKQGIVLAWLSLAFLSSAALAHHPVVDTGFGRTGPIRTISASTLLKGKAALSFQFEFYDFDAFTDRELLTFSAAGKDAHSIDSFFQAFVVGSYGVMDNLTLSLKLPYVSFDDVREAHADEPGEVHVHGDSRGVGDLSLFGQYRFLDTDGWEAALLFGLEFPTGRTDDRDIGGERFEVEFQPGSGSCDPFFGIAAQKSFGRFGLYVSLLYLMVTEGAQDTDLGDSFSYNAALSYTPVNRNLKWDLLLEINGESKQKQEVRGGKDPDSGGNVVLLSPGTRITWKERWSGFFSVGVPVAQDLNGLQNDLDYRLLMGVSAAF